ncbi:hypothetical protein M501DRAFT_999473 [Patellaria atrata CBS 101060]|uniref:Uncharacterized protein n=1 Tax=Patellaria atrata CBS 101060 TaxID=1346257 RepID=A0A9P4VP71_9PEZI|nr:hypothetical protein M501DRAFT_999473 [Patellaria atrata CBS 101060]
MPVIPLPQQADRVALSLHIRSIVPPLTALSQPVSRLFRRSAISSKSLSSISEHVSSEVSKRQQQENGISYFFLPTTYKGINDSPAPGMVVGIILGALAGFLLLIWLLSNLCTGGFQGGGNVMAGQEEVVVRQRPRSPGRSRRSGHSRRSGQMREVSGSPRRSRVLVEERRTSRPPPRPRSIIVDERRRVDGDDIVEVIEEHSDISGPPRRGSRRGSGSYRSVDPNLYAGGNYPAHEVRRSG